MTKEELEKIRNELTDRYVRLTGTENTRCDFKSGFDSAVALLIPRLEALEMAAKCLEVLEKEIDSGRGISIYKNEGSHRAIKQALDNLKEKKNE